MFHLLNKLPQPDAAVRIAERRLKVMPIIMGQREQRAIIRALLHQLQDCDLRLWNLQCQQCDLLRRLRAINSDILKCDTKNRERNDAH